MRDAREDGTVGHNTLLGTIRDASYLGVSVLHRRDPRRCPVDRLRAECRAATQSGCGPPVRESMTWQPGTRSSCVRPRAEPRPAGTQPVPTPPTAGARAGRYRGIVDRPIGNLPVEETR
jgi:hypothetical protein